MIALGVFGEKESLGYEASGVIRRIGPGVEAFQVGDKVALIADGLLRTRRVVPGNYCVKIPAGLSLEDAATMTTVFATAIYSLIHVGCINKGKVCNYLKPWDPPALFADIMPVCFDSFRLRWSGLGLHSNLQTDGRRGLSIFFSFTWANC